ncbi:hypothetical protein BG006_002454, partial [Podila minutissima]
MPAFMTFKEQIDVALDTKEVTLPTDMHPSVKLILQDQQQLIIWQGEIMRRVPGNFASVEYEIQSLQNTAAEHLDQAMLYLDAVFNYSMNFAKDFALHIESKLDYLISHLGPPPLHGSHMWYPQVNKHLDM